MSPPYLPLTVACVLASCTPATAPRTTPAVPAPTATPPVSAQPAAGTQAGPDAAATPPATEMSPRVAALLTVRNAVRDGEVVSVLGPRVEVGAMWYPDPSCDRRPHVVTDAAGRAELARCVNLLPRTEFISRNVPYRLLMASEHDIMVELAFDEQAGVTSIGPVDAEHSTARDRTRLTLIRGIPRPAFMPTDVQQAELDQALEAEGRRETMASHAVCHDGRGKITSRRLVDASASAVLDAATTKLVATIKTVPAYTLDGKPTPACDLVTYGYPDR